MEKKYSQNKRAGELCGMRPTGGTPIDFPCELGYRCPVCLNDWDEGLNWSEYFSFLWCEKCNFDYPVVLCIKDPKQATEAYLDIIKELKVTSTP